MIGYTGWVKKSSPPTTFNNIFAYAESFCITFCTFIGNLYPRLYTNYRSFILTFNEMALILLREPIIFMVSGFDFTTFWNVFTYDASLWLKFFTVDTEPHHFHTRPSSIYLNSWKKHAKFTGTTPSNSTVQCIMKWETFSETDVITSHAIIN